MSTARRSLAGWLHHEQRLVLLMLTMMAFVSTLCMMGADAAADGREAPWRLVELHNNARNSVQPTAANMLMLIWDDTLHTQAQNWADKCPSPNDANNGHSGRSGVGENIEWGWPSNTPARTMTDWVDKERPQYSFNSNSCSPTEDVPSCGHYTQVIWATSSKMGCGQALCRNLMGQTEVEVYVCQYSPAGNYRGQKPYISGPPASQCPAGYRKFNIRGQENLCRPLISWHSIP